MSSGHAHLFTDPENVFFSDNIDSSGLNGVVVSVADCYPKGAGFGSRVMLGIFP
jgi:hypothetical protein